MNLYWYVRRMRGRVSGCTCCTRSARVVRSEMYRGRREALIKHLQAKKGARGLCVCVYACLSAKEGIMGFCILLCRLVCSFHSGVPKRRALREECFLYMSR